jgi:CubicO group peptidase (beta-lactamase class C family)
MIGARFQALAEVHAVVGASMAIVRNGRTELFACGTRDRDSGAPVDPGTVFDAASLTKPLVAYVVLQLADRGLLSLDEPLASFISPVVAGDPRAASITARHLLAHTAGLQNLRGEEPLRLFFDPGSRFSYSSVGFMYLQRAVETKTGEPLERTVARLVFEPLRMHSSSLQWRDAFALNEAVPHERDVRLAPHRAAAANASYSLKTTARDYASFLAAVLEGAGLAQATWREWLDPAVMVPRGKIVCLEAQPLTTDPDIGWGLGWGLEPAAGTFFQWGKMDGSRAFVMGSVGQGTGVVLLANSNTGLRLLDAVTADVLAGDHPALRWLIENVTE